MSGLRAIALVASREAGDRLRNRAFMVGTLAVLLGVVAVIALPALFGDDGPPSYRLGVPGPADAELSAAIERAAEAQDVEIEVAEVPDADSAAAAIDDGDLDAVLLGDEMRGAGGVPATLVGLVNEARTQVGLAAEIDRLGLSEQQARRILEPSEPVSVVDLSGEAEEETNPEQALMAFAATVLLFIVIQINGNSLLTGAIEEKSSRVIEVLLGTLRPRHLLAGKLAALTLIALVQVGVIVTGALVTNAVVGLFEVPAIAGAVISVSLLMIAVGFVFYAAMYTVAGSMTPSIEDAQAIAGPLAMAVVATYFAVVFAVIPSPDGLAARILTFLPPTAPFTVPARVALGAIAAWEVVAATALTVTGTVLAVGLAGRLYGAALLAGGRLTWREAWRAEPIR